MTVRLIQNNFIIEARIKHGVSRPSEVMFQGLSIPHISSEAALLRETLKHRSSAFLLHINTFITADSKLPDT